MKIQQQLIVKAVGCDLDALDHQLTSECELLVPSDMAEADFVEKLRNLFASRA